MKQRPYFPILEEQRQKYGTTFDALSGFD